MAYIAGDEHKQPSRPRPARMLPGICFEEQSKKKKKAVFAIPTPKGGRPHAKTLESLEKCLPLIEAAGWEHGMTQAIGNPYISGARAEMTRRGMDAKASCMIYIDYDVSWDPEDMLKLLETPGEVVCGTYRAKTEDTNEILYMGAVYTNEDFTPVCREDGCIKAIAIPAGFLKVTESAIDRFMEAYPELCFGPQYALAVDLFNHGAHERLWWGEDYAFARRWRDCGGDCWIIPDLNLDHWQGDFAYQGNFHQFLMSQPGGINDPAKMEFKNVPQDDVQAWLAGQGERRDMAR